MIEQTRINDGDAIAETLNHPVANGNDFRSVSIDVAPSPLAFDGGEPFGIGKGSFEVRRDYHFSAVIDESPDGSLRRGKEWASAGRLATTRGAEQSKNERECDRAAAIRPAAKIM